MRCRVALTALGLLACDQTQQGRCTLSPAQRVALAAGHHFDATALVVLPEGALAVYSDTSGVWTRVLAGDGTPRAEPRRLGDACSGGLAATALADARMIVVCSRPAAQAGSISAFSLTRAGRAEGAERVIAPLGLASRGVAITAHGDGAEVAFHDGGPEAHRIWLAHVSADAEKPAGSPHALSQAGVVATAPSVLSHDGQLYAAYVTSEFTLEATRASLVLLDVQHERRVSFRLHHHDATPQLARFDDGLAITFRDRPTTNARVEQFVARLKPDLSFAAQPRRIGRASGLGSPRIDQCGGQAYAAAPIEHGSELYVIFHGLDAGFRPLEPNHQCYATERSLVGAQAACAGDGVVALVSEESDPSSGNAELFGMRFSCR